MKLASVYFDDNVCIPGGKDTGGGVRHDLRESSFHASDGWDIEWDGHVLFTLWHEGMPTPARVGGYGFTFVAETAAGTVRIVEGQTASGLGEAISEESLGDAVLSGEKLLAGSSEAERGSVKPDVDGSTPSRSAKRSRKR